MRRGTWLLVLMAAGSAWAQTGGLRVVVTDAGSSAPLLEAEIVLTSATRQVARTVLLTGADGAVEFPVLRAGGGYQVEVRLAGYAPVSLPGVRVTLGGTSVLPVGLFPELHESVGVSGRREGVELADSGTSTTFTAEFTEDLPLYGRFYQTLLALAPGVLDADEDGNPNVLGARASDFKTQVGGVANTDPLTGGFLSHLNLESIDALEVVTAGAGAEYGRAQGGFASIVQKQGGNDFEGVAGLLWGSHLLDGNGASSSEAPRFDRFQPFLQVSGPIVRDRLWYRLSHEWIHREEPIALLEGIEVLRQRQGIHSDQLTWQATPRNKFALQLQRDPLRLSNVGIGTSVGAESARALERGGTTTSLTWTAPHSARLFAEGLIAFQEHREEVLPQTPGVDSRCGVSRDYENLQAGQCMDTSTGLTSGSWPLDSRDRRRRFTLRGQVTLSLGAGRAVSQQWKAGLSIENERYFRRLTRGIEGQVLRFNPFFLPDLGTYFVELHVPGTSLSRASGSSAGLFVEDQVRLGSRLAVTAGLRVDREDLGGEAKEAFDPSAEARRFGELVAQGLPATDAMAAAFTGFDDIEDFQLGLGQVLGTSVGPASALLEMSSNWPRKRRLGNLQLGNTFVSPRLAVAWDPWGSGKTKLAATAGRYHDKVFLSVPLLGMEPPTSAMAFDVVRFRGAWWEVGAQGGAENARVTTVDPDLRTPYQDELTLSAERELWPETSFKVTWVRRRFRDQLQDVDVNHVTGDHGRCVLGFDLGAPPMLESPGSGQTLVDPYTGERYPDVDPGPGDGRIDDCMGDIVQPGGLLSPWTHRRDGLPDLYALNPGWGQVMVVRNANTADYSGVLVELTRRYYQGWGMRASYTWSRAVGDAEQFDQLLGDEPALLREERGFLAYDQRHVAKIVAALDTGGDWRVGGTVRFESGLPYSVLEPVTSYYGVAPQYGLSFTLPQARYIYPTGRRNDRRNPGFWTFDARLAREFPRPSGRTFGLTLEVFNLLNDDTLRILEIREGLVFGVRRFGRRFQVGLRGTF